jgi:hypothetical protein
MASSDDAEADAGGGTSEDRTFITAPEALRSASLRRSPAKRFAPVGLFAELSELALQQLSTGIARARIRVLGDGLPPG